MAHDDTTDAQYLLPPAAYWSEEWLEDERQRLFGRVWTLVGHEDELLEPGSYVTATIGRSPVLVVRTGDGTLRAFHNLCRHRGMQLLEGSGKLGRQVECFYHHWRYGLNGSLEAVPQGRDQFPSICREQWGLLPASVGTWGGLVFAHPDPHAPSLQEFMAGLPDHFGSYRPELLRQVGTASFEIACNWKLLIENHIDVYHLWYLHRGSLSDFDHTRFHHEQVGDHWTSWEPLRAGDPAAAELHTGTIPIRHLDERDRLGLGAHLIFPNIMIAAAAEFFATYVAEPVAPDRTRLHLRVRAEADADGEVLVKALRSFIDEDIVACEAVQRAVRSPAYAVGPLARTHERPLQRFHTSLLAQLQSAL